MSEAREVCVVGTNDPVYCGKLEQEWGRELVYSMLGDPRL